MRQLDASRDFASLQCCSSVDSQVLFPNLRFGFQAVTLQSLRLLAGSGGKKIVTWLILPVVICLSQRLSHACLSISKLYSETANGSLNQLSFI